MLTIRISLLISFLLWGMPILQAQPESVLNRIEESIKRAKSPDRKAHLYRQKGDLLSEHKQYLTAIENYEKSLKLYEKAIKKEGDQLAAEFLLVYLRKGFLQLRETNTALSTYQYAVELYLDPSYEDPPLLYNLGVIYYNIGLIQQDLSHSDKALKAYQQSLNYREQLVQKNPEQLPSLLLSSNKVSNLIYSAEQPEKITQQLEQVKTTVTNLGNISPMEKEEALGEINLGLGEAYNSYDEAKKRPYFEAAVEKYTLLEENEADFNPLNQAFAHLQLGIVEKHDQNFKAAASQYHRALYLFQKLQKEHDDIYYKVQVSDAYAKLIQVLKLDDQKEEVKKYYPKYLETLKNWADDQPEKFIQLYCNQLNQYGLYLHEQEESQKALDFLSEANRIFKPYVEENPSRYLTTYNRYNNDLVNTLWDDGDYDLTVMMLDQKFDFNLSYIGKYSNATVQALQTLLDHINYNIEQYNKTQNGELTNQTQVVLQRANELFTTHQQSFGINDVTSFRHQLIEVEFEVANMEGFGKAHHAIAQALKQKDYKTAVAEQQKILRIWELIVESNTTQESEAIIVLNRALHEGLLAWYHLLAQDFKAAEAAARQSLELNPQGSWVITNLAAALLFQQQWAEAQALYPELADQDYGDGQTFREVFLTDLLDFEEAGLPAEAIEKAREWLED